MSEIKTGDILTFPKGVEATAVGVRKDTAMWVKSFISAYLFYGASAKFPFHIKQKLRGEKELCFGSYKVLGKEMGLLCLENIDRVKPRYILVEEATLVNIPFEKSLNKRAKGTKTRNEREKIKEKIWVFIVMGLY